MDGFHVVFDFSRECIWQDICENSRSLGAHHLLVAVYKFDEFSNKRLHPNGRLRLRSYFSQGGFADFSLCKDIIKEMKGICSSIGAHGFAIVYAAYSDFLYWQGDWTLSAKNCNAGSTVGVHLCSLSNSFRHADGKYYLFRRTPRVFRVLLVLFWVCEAGTTSSENDAIRAMDPLANRWDPDTGKRGTKATGSLCHWTPEEMARSQVPSLRAVMGPWRMHRSIDSQQLQDDLNNCWRGLGSNNFLAPRSRGNTFVSLGRAFPRERLQQ